MNDFHTLELGRTKFRDAKLKALRSFYADNKSTLTHEETQHEENVLFQLVAKEIVFHYTSAKFKGKDFKCGKVWIEVIEETGLVTTFAKNLFPSLPMKSIELVEIALAVSFDFALGE